MAESATAAQLASRRGPAEAGHPQAVAAELAALVRSHPAVAAVSDHGALFSAPDDSAPGRGTRVTVRLGLDTRVRLSPVAGRIPSSAPRPGAASAPVEPVKKSA